MILPEESRTNSGQHRKTGTKTGLKKESGTNSGLGTKVGQKQGCIRAQTKKLTICRLIYDGTHILPDIF